MSILIAVVAVLGEAKPPTAGAVRDIQDDPVARQLYRRLIDPLRE